MGLVCRQATTWGKWASCFAALAWVPKATVQAALAAAPGALIAQHTGNGKYADPVFVAEQQERATIFLIVCILSIVLTAPTAATAMSIAGPRWLPSPEEDLEKGASEEGLLGMAVDPEHYLDLETFHRTMTGIPTRKQHRSRSMPPEPQPDVVEVEECEVPRAFSFGFDFQIPDDDEEDDEEEVMAKERKISNYSAALGRAFGDVPDVINNPHVAAVLARQQVAEAEGGPRRARGATR
mmetsp:Transcript_39095/g.93843  ORF Transcript_39095/g.93843 Transcript_39095/m.93843 type:complete len:238 (+) Transcript_39095:34-747(+)